MLTGKYKRASSVSSDDCLTKELAEQALLNRIAESADGSENTLEISVDVQSPSDGTRVFYPITTDELVLAHALISTVRNGASTISVELVFSAYDGTVLDGRSLTSDIQEPTEVYNGTGSITVNGIFDTEYRTYILFDQERNIQIFNGQKGYSDRRSSDGHTNYIVPLTSDYERSSDLPLAAKRRFPDLSAGAFERFGRPIMVFAPLSPQQFFLFWVSVWVKKKLPSTLCPEWVKMGQTSSRPICFPSGQELRRSKQRLRIPIERFIIGSKQNLKIV